MEHIHCNCGHCHHEHSHPEQHEESPVKKILLSLVIFIVALLIEHLPLFARLE